MRALTAGEIAVLGSATRRLAYKVEIQNHVGTWQDFTALSGVDWVMDIGGAEGLDEPIPTLSLSLRRDHAGLSLAPFRGDSSLNTGGTAIDIGRGVRVSIAYVAWGATPVPGDFQTIFVGTIDALDFSQPAVPIHARNAAGATLVDSWVREETPYGSDAGTPLETVIQSIFTTWAPGITLDVPVSPGFMVTPYMQQPESVWDAARTLAGLPGWDIRILWNPVAGEFRPTLVEPDRAATVPAWTFSPDLIHNVESLSIDRTWIRNSIRVTYLDDANDVQSVDVSDAISIARFGEQWAEIIRGEGSPINTAPEATALANAALSDLAWPIADQVVQVPYFWPLELGDLYRFSANGIHYNTAQDLAVTAHRWEIRGGRARSWITVRGKPAGFYRTWLRESELGGERSPILFPQSVHSNTGEVWVTPTRLDPRIQSWRLRQRVEDIGSDVFDDPAYVDDPDDNELSGNTFGVPVLLPLRLKDDEQSNVSGFGYDTALTTAAAQSVAAPTINIRSIAALGNRGRRGLTLARFGVRWKSEATDTEPARVAIGGIPGFLVDSVWVFDKTYAEPDDDTPQITPEIDTATDLPIDIMDPADVDADGYLLYIVERPARGFQRFVWMIPLSDDGVEGPTYVMRVDAASTGQAPYFDRLRQTGLLAVDVFGRVNDPEDQGGTLHVWLPDADFSGAPSGSLTINATSMPFSFGPGTSFGGTALLDDIPSDPRVRAQLALKFDSEDGRTTGQVLMVLEGHLGDLIDEFGQLTVESWMDAMEAALQGPNVGFGETLPPDGSVYQTWYVPSENKIYSWDGDSWEVLEGNESIVVGNMIVGRATFGAITSEAIATGALAAKIAEIHTALIADLSIGGLRLLGSDTGAIVHGVLQGTGVMLDLDATGTDPALSSANFEILANGDAFFSGELQAAVGTFEGDFTAGTAMFHGEIFARMGIRFEGASTVGTPSATNVQIVPVADTISGGWGCAITAGTGGELVVWGQRGGTNPIVEMTKANIDDLIASVLRIFDGTVVQQVNIGAANSGGAGQRLLTINN